MNRNLMMVKKLAVEISLLMLLIIGYHHLIEPKQRLTC
uniref:Uncharacterized protein n=1 Tax=Siphoviridae sp. ct2vX3 TaxID=2825318 RepID=A0A8S5PY50_9CAUD|nr:MAG TPA: hypothetical protein [Siphoviridae sp. ct2vX3]